MERWVMIVVLLIFIALAVAGVFGVLWALAAKENGELKNQLVYIQRSLAEKEKALAELEKTLNEKEGALKETRTKLEYINASLAQAKTALQLAETKISQLETQLSACRRDNSRLGALVAGLNATSQKTAVVKQIAAFVHDFFSVAEKHYNYGGTVPQNVEKWTFVKTVFSGWLNRVDPKINTGLRYGEYVAIPLNLTKYHVVEVWIDNGRGSWSLSVMLFRQCDFEEWARGESVTPAYRGRAMYSYSQHGWYLNFSSPGDGAYVLVLYNDVDSAVYRGNVRLLVTWYWNVSSPVATSLNTLTLLLKVMKTRKVALLYRNDKTGITLTSLIKDAVTQAGASVVMSEGYDPDPKAFPTAVPEALRKISSAVKDYVDEDFVLVLATLRNDGEYALRQIQKDPILSTVKIVGPDVLSGVATELKMAERYFGVLPASLQDWPSIRGSSADYQLFRLFALLNQYAEHRRLMELEPPYLGLTQDLKIPTSLQKLLDVYGVAEGLYLVLALRASGFNTTFAIVGRPDVRDLFVLEWATVCPAVVLPRGANLTMFAPLIDMVRFGGLDITMLYVYQPHNPALYLLACPDAILSRGAVLYVDGVTKAE